MGLVLRKNEGETWKEALLREAARYELEEEVIHIYEGEIRLGAPEWSAAWAAAYEWDILRCEDD